MSGRLLLLGAGYCARALATSLLQEGWEVRGTSRDPDSLAAQGIEPFAFGAEQPLDPAAFAGVTHVLSSIPPQEGRDPALEALLAAGERVPWVGYLSSTGVYGDHEGAWVDEESELREARSPRARARQRCEAAWRSSGQPWLVFRLAGIYGPGRGPLARARAGRARRYDAPEHLFSRIHRDDVVAVLRAALDLETRERVFNLCDEEPATSAEVMAFACELLGVPTPPLEPLSALPPFAADFYRDRRRVRSVRLGPELGVSLRYPTYREGLRADA